VKRIGEIAARLVANPVELVAAANQKRSTELKSGGRSAGRGSDQPPTLYADAPAPSGSRVKGRGAMPRQVQNRGWARSREGDDARSVNAPVLVLVVDNGWRRDYRRPKGSPSPALRHPLLMLVHSTSSGVF
jgi:hypothetical protein